MLTRCVAFQPQMITLLPPFIVSLMNQSQRKLRICFRIVVGESKALGNELAKVERQLGTPEMNSGVPTPRQYSRHYIKVIFHIPTLTLIETAISNVHTFRSLQMQPYYC